MRVGIGWSYLGKGFDLRQILLNRKILGRYNDPDGEDMVSFRQAGAPKYDPRGPLYNKDDIWSGTFKFGPNLSDVTGSILSISRTGDGKHHYIRGLKLPYEEIAVAMRTSSKTDDLRIFAKALAGNDSLDTTALADQGMRDRLEGFAGNDKLTAGGGADRLVGGAGADTFIYKSVDDSTFDYRGRDTIYDFSSKQKDKIDLRKVDANGSTTGNQAFSFIGNQDFHGAAGEIRWEREAGGTYVHADVDGDGNADFSILLKGVVRLTMEDFYL